MIKNMVFSLAGGLGLFFLGMSLLSNGLKQAAGQKLKNLLGTLTKKPVYGIFVGALVTSLIQSSSATTVMTVGLVNAGLLTLKQALGVVLGANIGTTVTAWVVSTLGIAGFKITLYSLPAIWLGFLLQITGKTQKRKGYGNILLGFGLLFLGISFMKDAFGAGGFNISESPEVQEFLIYLCQHPILALLVGAGLTALLQSSSAFIAVVQVLAFGGAFGTDWYLVLRITIPFILGSNVGTTITAQLAALQTSRNARRAAIGHTIFNTMGVIYVLPLVWIGVFSRLVVWVTPWELSQSTVMVHIAIAHTVFNALNTIVFLPVIGWLEAIVMKILPVTQDELAAEPVVLERHLFNTPVLALEQAKREILRMAERAKDAVQKAVEGLVEGEGRKLERAMVGEDVIDEFQLAITSYLVALSREQLSEEVSNELPVLLHTVNDLERIGDHAVNIVEIAQRKIAQGVTFTDLALEEAWQLKKESDQMFDQIKEALGKNDTEAARSALVNEENLNRMQIDFRRNHVQRMSQGVCSAEAGLIFCDLVDNVEKIGDHLTNIAQAVIGGLQWADVEPKISPNNTN